MLKFKGQSHFECGVRISECGMEWNERDTGEVQVSSFKFQVSGSGMLATPIQRNRLKAELQTKRGRSRFRWDA